MHGRFLPKMLLYSIRRGYSEPFHCRLLLWFPWPVSNVCPGVAVRVSGRLPAAHCRFLHLRRCCMIQAWSIRLPIWIWQYWLVSSVPFVCDFWGVWVVGISAFDKLLHCFGILTRNYSPAASGGGRGWWGQTSGWLSYVLEIVIECDRRTDV